MGVGFFYRNFEAGIGMRKVELLIREVEWNGGL